MSVVSEGACVCVCLAGVCVCVCCLALCLAVESLCVVWEVCVTVVCV